MTIKLLISEQEISNKISTLGTKINDIYENEPLTIVVVLKGAFVFASDLIRRLSMPTTVEFIGVSSYKGTRSTGHVRITHDLNTDIKGKNILIVEDIIDTGRTLDYLIEFMKVREPKSIRTCTFLNKPFCNKMSHSIDFCAFEIEDQFVVGYGLDVDQKYRGLPYLGVIENTPLS